MTKMTKMRMQTRLYVNPLQQSDDSGVSIKKGVKNSNLQFIVISVSIKDLKKYKIIQFQIGL